MVLIAKRWVLGAALVLVGGLAFAGLSAASAQTLQEVEARDRLIADQENLLNAYRCLFGADVGLVPGGCANPDQVSPGAAPPNPAQGDLDARDALIAAQEALLNAYRCRFGVDTEIVAGGCPDTATTQPTPTAQAEPQPHWEDDGCQDALGEGWSSDPYGNCKAPDTGAGGLSENANPDGTTPFGSNARANNDEFSSSITYPFGSKPINPIFNIYDNVKLHYGRGSERDFLRLGARGELGNSIEACEDGQIVDLWFYVHNGVDSRNNGYRFEGHGVAWLTTVKLDVDESAISTSHRVVGSIEAYETDPISDGVTISCSGKEIKLKYKGVSYFGTPAPVDAIGGNYALKGDMTDGAFLGYTAYGNNGVVPGCWDFRARINIQLEVEVL